MLTRTFCHLPGIGAQSERSLWEQGCDGWDCFLSAPTRYRIGTACHELVCQEIRNSQEALSERRHQYFARSLGMRDAWRAWREFRDGCVYLDIETDGGREPECVTLIGLYDGREFVCLRKDEDLGNFPDIISHYGMIVTFFGSGFDLPVLQRCFPSLRLDQIHLDLCPTLKRIGFKGGLKKIEKQFQIERSEATDGLSGWDAVRLWRQFQRGDEIALQTLVEYNREDVVNLERLAELSFEKLWACCGYPSQMKLPF